MSRRRMFGQILLITVLLQACTSSPTNIPQVLESQIDKNLTFAKVLQIPEAHTGKVILLGGEILHTHRVQEDMQLEILQLPLDEWQSPSRQRTSSKGRFLAFIKETHDPATLPIHTRLTIVGEVTGSTIATLDESQYRYPILRIRHVHVWDNVPYKSRKQSHPRSSLFGK